MKGEDSVTGNERNIIPKHNLKNNIWHVEWVGATKLWQH